MIMVGKILLFVLVMLWDEGAFVGGIFSRRTENFWGLCLLCV